MSFPSISPKQSFPSLEVFDDWNEEKKQIHTKEQDTRYINSREVWYIHLGQNIGSESNGKGLFLRPALVIKKVGSMFLVAPMTTKGKDSIFYHTVECVQYATGIEAPDISRIQLSQIKVIDKRRFSQHIGTIEKHEFENIKKKLRDLLL